MGVVVLRSQLPVTLTINHHGTLCRSVTERESVFFLLAAAIDQEQM